MHLKYADIQCLISLIFKLIKQLHKYSFFLLARRIILRLAIIIKKLLLENAHTLKTLAGLIFAMKFYRLSLIPTAHSLIPATAETRSFELYSNHNCSPFIVHNRKKFIVNRF